MNNMDIFGDTKGEATYDPSLDENKFVVVPEGDYEAHAHSLELKENVTVRGKFLSDIFVPVFKIASGEFKNRKVKSKGFFRFKNPDKEKFPNLSDNSGSNKGYMSLEQSLGVETSSEEKDGKTIFKLPFLEQSHIEGKPVIIRIEHDSWTNNNGEDVITPKATSVYKWESGKAVVDDSNLPF